MKKVKMLEKRKKTVKKNAKKKEVKKIQICPIPKKKRRLKKKKTRK